MTLEKLKPLSVFVDLPNEHELEVVKTMFANKESEPVDPLKTLFTMRQAFPKMMKLFTAIQTFGCSTAACESSFSTVNRVNRLNRLSMSEKRLADLSFLAFESKMINDDMWEGIWKHFNTKKNRKVQLY